jgi:uncharacterized protein (DUF927 family)/5S rRNA maturation endonuclease (ribonuclease M5)
MNDRNKREEQRAEKNIKGNAFLHLKISPERQEAQEKKTSHRPSQLNGSHAEQEMNPVSALNADSLLKPLTEEEQKKATQAQKKQQGKTYQPVVPVPADAPDFTKDTPYYHNKKFGGKPIAAYPFPYSDGSLAGYMVRWHVNNADGTPKLTQEGKQEKEVIPYSFVEDQKGRRSWKGCGFPEPRPLYNLPELIERPHALALVVEGEKNVEVLKPLLPDYVLTTSAHGAQSVAKSDWLPLKDRNVVLSLDCDTAGIDYGDKVYAQIQKAGALSVQTLDLQRMMKTLMGKEDLPKGYDLADALQEGLDPLLLKKEFENFLSPYIPSHEWLSQELPQGFRLNEQKQIEYWYEKKNIKGEIIDSGWRWLCGYLIVTHRTRDKDNQQWAKIAKLMDGDGLKKEMDIPSSVLAGDGNTLKELLLSAGLSFNMDAIHKIRTYLHQSNPKARRRTVDKTGWYNHTTYVLPHKTYGNPHNEDIVLKTGKNAFTYEQRGTLEEWQRAIGKYAEGNSRLQGAILLTLASPVLNLLGLEPFGIHFYGHSSIGKSTTSHVASSIFGGKIHSWNATKNALEGSGLMANDNTLFLDEISQVSADEFREAVYMLLNGQTKGRADKKGDSRPTSTFKANILSNGEITGEGKAQESKRSKQYNAGQAIRLMEIPAETGYHGILENLHGFESSEKLIKHLNERSKLYRGTVGEAWLTLLTSQRQKEILSKIVHVKQAFEEEHLKSRPDGQVKRAIGHFALMAGCEAVAVREGILSWEQASIHESCHTHLIKAWIHQRGGIQSHEEINFVKEVIIFLQEHGNSRFQPVDAEENMRIINRMGYKKNIEGRTEYYAFTDSFNKELIRGRDKTTLLNALAEKGILERDQEQFAKLKRLPDFNAKRVYVLKNP